MKDRACLKTKPKLYPSCDGYRPSSDGGRRQERPPKNSLTNVLPDAGWRPPSDSYWFRLFRLHFRFSQTKFLLLQQLPSFLQASPSFLRSYACTGKSGCFGESQMAATPAVTAVVAEGIALEAGVCSADILAQSNPANRAHAEVSESAAGRGLEHRTATGLILRQSEQRGRRFWRPLIPPEPNPLLCKKLHTQLYLSTIFAIRHTAYLESRSLELASAKFRRSLATRVHFTCSRQAM